MSRIASVFEDPGHRALVAYLTIGYPSLEATLELVPALVAGGCDIVELGIPFSDPLADGATIQKASFQALKNGVTPRLCLEVARRLRQKVTVPLLFMSYYNPIYSQGLESFCARAAEAGIDGLIIPDLPPEEGGELQTAAGPKGIDVVYLLAPTSTDERVRAVAENSTGFIYLVSLTGVTGARESLSEGLEAFVGRVRKVAKQPLCVGFGISTPEQAARVARVADGVIVGSRLLQVIETAAQPAKAATELMRGFRDAIDGANLP